MEHSTTSDRDTAIVAAVGRGVSLRTLCAVYGLDAMTIRYVVEKAGQAMPVGSPGANGTIAARDAEILRRALAGEDFSVIAKAHGLSREMVRLVVKKHTGLSAKDLKEARDTARRQFKRQKARDLASGDRSLSLDDLARLAGLSNGEVEIVLGPAESARRRRDRTVSTAASREQILEGLRLVSSLPGGLPLSGPFYDLRRGGRVSSQRVTQVFGTWSAACEAAGVQMAIGIRTHYTQAWSREACLRWVRTYLDSTPKPTFVGFDAWLRNREGAPSSSTVRLRCGKWIETMREAYELDDGEASRPPERPTGALEAGFESAAHQTDLVVPRRYDQDSAPDNVSAEVSTSGASLPRPSKGQGQAADVDERRKVELAAQERLAAHYRALGWRVCDTHLNSPYDLLATRGDETLYLEAKGTRSAGETVLVTRGEVEHARMHPSECFMGIWSGIVLDENDEVRPDCGEFRVIPFDPDLGLLVVVGYQWRPGG